MRFLDAVFENERGINGKSADERRTIRQEPATPHVVDLEAHMRAERPNPAAISPR